MDRKIHIGLDTPLFVSGPLSSPTQLNAARTHTPPSLSGAFNSSSLSMSHHCTDPYSYYSILWISPQKRNQNITITLLSTLVTGTRRKFSLFSGERSLAVLLY